MHNHISQRLKNLIRSNGIKKYELANKLNVASGTITRWADTDRRCCIDITKISEICDIFKVSIHWFITGKLESSLKSIPLTKSESFVLQGYRSAEKQLAKVYDSVAEYSHHTEKM